MSSELDYDAEYARRIERHANKVVDAAFEEGWLTFLPEDEHQPPLQRAINELARNLRSKHLGLPRVWLTRWVEQFRPRVRAC